MLAAVTSSITKSRKSQNCPIFRENVKGIRNVHSQEYKTLTMMTRIFITP